MQKQAEDTVVIEGKNVEEALQAACDRLETTPNQVEYEVVDENRGGGMFGFLRGRSVRVKVWKKSEAQRMIHGIVRELFERMQVNVEHRVLRADDAYEVEIETQESDGLLIGRGGDTLKALQHLISRMVGQQDETIRVRVDVAGYRKRRIEQLRKKAHDLAERARSSSRDVMTEPLPADERRIVHLELADMEGISTRAVGEGHTKRVAVSASGRAAGAPSGDGRGRRGGRGRSDRFEGGSRRGGRGSRGDRSGRPASGETMDREEVRDRDEAVGRTEGGQGGGFGDRGGRGGRRGRGERGSLRRDRGHEEAREERRDDPREGAREERREERRDDPREGVREERREERRDDPREGVREERREERRDDPRQEAREERPEDRHEDRHEDRRKDAVLSGETEESTAGSSPAEDRGGRRGRGEGRRPEGGSRRGRGGQRGQQRGRGGQGGQGEDAQPQRKVTRAIFDSNYFNIPDSVRENDDEEGEGNGEGDSKQGITYGRRRTHHKGRR